ncbi:DUF4157 domain-containing protein [Bacteroides sp. 51]|uniref:eCIS core domain-containing protein n=1 Tax=Bacteroides sp. 51 TaxID=2302938 RepID=UPI0013D69202|nr:DUF4157 domain-containing protein [Bacteroides sp. 51]NDV82953.1 DUF4157 domain-containing protein [Bacteroides sp. 51]
MNAERTHKEDSGSRVAQQRSAALQMQDNRETAALQSGLVGAIQRAEDEEELLQGKFEEGNHTGMPDDVKTQMEDSFSTDFSSVRIHADSARAPEVGALAYTQGTDIHFAPGQFKPETSAGQQLLGHELTHVIQQAEGRVSPTTEVGGMPVNDDVSLETEADVMGMKAAR